MIHAIFGGHLRSQVKCTVCKHASNVYDPVMDLSLDISHASTLQKALRNFTQPELLSGSNQFKCERCNKKVDAVKQFTIHEAPAVLTLQLKRFTFMSRHGNKLNKHVKFTPTLDLTAYMSSRREGFAYSLHAVLVHSGHSLNSGHYYTYVKNSNGTWHMMNDSQVQTVSTATVFAQHAYILFYHRQQAQTPSAAGSQPALSSRPAAAPKVPVPVSKAVAATMVLETNAATNDGALDSGLGMMEAVPSSSESSDGEKGHEEWEQAVQETTGEEKEEQDQEELAKPAEGFQHVSRVCLGTRRWDVTYRPMCITMRDAGVCILLAARRLFTVPDRAASCNLTMKPCNCPNATTSARACRAERLVHPWSRGKGTARARRWSAQRRSGLDFGGQQL